MLLSQQRLKFKEKSCWNYRYRLCMSVNKKIVRFAHARDNTKQVTEYFFLKTSPAVHILLKVKASTAIVEHDWRSDLIVDTTVSL